jgi:hypothetical protein
MGNCRFGATRDKNSCKTADTTDKSPDVPKRLKGSTNMKTSAVLLLGLIIFLTAAPAYAYVDPGTGGMLIQLVTGGVAGLLVLARLYWARLFGKAPTSHEEELTKASNAASARSDDSV